MSRRILYNVNYLSIFSDIKTLQIINDQNYFEFFFTDVTFIQDLRI